MSPATKRFLIGAPLVLALIVALLFAFRPRPVPVDFATVSKGSMRVTVRDDGTTRVKDVYVVSAPIAGRLQRIESEVGDPVVAGQTILARIQPSDPEFLDARSRAGAEADVEAAEAALALARAAARQVRAQLDYAEAEQDRAIKLADRGNISMSALDRSQMEVRTHEASLQTAEADIRLRQANLAAAQARLIMPESGDGGTPDSLCCIDVRAPIDGVLLRILQESETVMASGTALVQIGDPRNLEIVTDLLSTDAVSVRAGADVSIEDWGGAPLAGRVRRIEPYGFTKISALGIDEQRVNVIIDIEAPPEAWRALGHGYRVETAITVWEVGDALRVPLGALFRDGAEWAVFVDDNGVARHQAVTIDHRNDAVAEVVAGLAVGQRVILHPSDRVVDGIEIESRNAL